MQRFDERMSEANDILVARGLRKTYSLGATRLEVLKGIDLDVRRGEVMGIVGASGAGKSTLLHLLGGLDEPTQGAVTLEGVAVFDLSRSQRALTRNQKVGFVFQSYHLLPELDALENVTLPARLVRGANRQAACEVADRGADLLNAVGLSDRLHHRPSELSGGEQQRVAIARALINRPALILADEPTGNLDSKTGEAIIEMLLRLRAEQNATLVVVTHDPAISQHCTRTRQIVDGKIKDE